MTYILTIPRNKTNIISILDNVINFREVNIPDAPTSRVLGMYTKKWRRDGILSLYTEPLQKKTLLKLNVSGVEKVLRQGRRVEYRLDTNLLNVQL
jgi:hypothetical protein